MQHSRISNVELTNVVILIECVNEINIFIFKFETFKKIFEQCTRNKLSKWNITAINKFNNDDDCYHVITFTIDDDFTIIYMFFYFQYEIIEILRKKIHDNNTFFEFIVNEVTCNKISLQYEIVIKRLFERNKLIKILKLMIEDTLNLYFCDQSLCFIEWKNMSTMMNKRRRKVKREREDERCENERRWIERRNQRKTKDLFICRKRAL
jgi:hypothetical protein